MIPRIIIIPSRGMFRNPVSLISCISNALLISFIFEFIPNPIYDYIGIIMVDCYIFVKDKLTIGIIPSIIYIVFF